MKIGILGSGAVATSLANGFPRSKAASRMLWCIPGFLRQEWTHAFKLLN
jgi:hypothetical protein